MLKREEIAYPTSCLNKAADDEPVFVLRAQDASAPHLISLWLQANPQISSEKRAEAEACREAMLNWHTRKIAD